MKNFLRALKFSWPYRGRIFVSVVAAVFAAMFWSLNFTAIFPVLKVLGGDKSLQDSVQESISNLETKTIPPLEKRVKELTDQRERLIKENPPDRANQEWHTARDLAREESKLESARQELHLNHWAKKWIIDKFFPDDPFQTLAILLGLVVAAVLIKGFFEFWQESLVGNVVNLSLFDLRNLFYRKALHLDVNNFSEDGTHELMSRFTNDAEILNTGLKTVLGKVIAEPLKAIGCLIIAFWINWQLTMIFLVLVPIALLTIARIGRVMKKATRRVLERISSIYKILQETFVGIRVVKAFAGETRERQRFHRATRDYYQKAMLVVYIDALAGPIIEMLGVAAVAGALLAGAYLVFQHRMEAETLLQLYALLAAIADPVRKLSSVFTRIQSGCAAADRVFAYIDKEPKIRPNHAAPVLSRHGRSIEFREVCYSYQAGQPVLTNINLTVRHGETIALVGKNGCGKSTLLGMLPRFWDPDHGNVFIDGVDLRTVNLRSLRRQIGIVTQDTILFDDTISNNIAYARRHATPEQIEDAARKAQAHDFVLKLSHGYDTRIGEAGTRLSGGQKQRIALARAFLRDPSILILDEFTSQADSESELEVHRMLRGYLRGRTTFIITHRLNTLEIADRIVVIDAGRLVAVGTHLELINTCHLYQRLHEAHMQKLVA